MKRLTGWPLTIATALIAGVNVAVATLDSVPEWLRVTAAVVVVIGSVLGISAPARK